MSRIREDGLGAVVGDALIYRNRPCVVIDTDEGDYGTRLHLKFESGTVIITTPGLDPRLHNKE